MTAVVGLVLAVPVLVVVTGLQEPDPTGLFGWTVALAHRGSRRRRERSTSARPSRLTALEDTDEERRTFLPPAAHFTGVAGILAVVLTACTGRGGGQLPPSAGFTGPASFGFSFSCENGRLRIQLSYTDHGTNPIGSGFSIHGTVDQVDPVLESATCIDHNPPPPPENQLIFLGRYRLTSSAPPAFPKSCPTQETTTSPLCRFEVIVQDNDRNRTPSMGDFFSIKLSTVTEVFTNDCPPGGIPPCVITEFPIATVFYARAGTLSSGNLTVD